ncbi:TPA: flagellar basal-body rod protein FlgF [Stenotrophomonas maltophilia]
MFQALFNSLSGMFSFSRSLDTVSNNVSNMNTPGFRGSDAFFTNVEGGFGSRITGDDMRTNPGDLRQTENATDLAVNGNGYFVLRDPAGDLHYTRAGQFRFDEHSLLVDSVNGYQVMGLDGSGNMVAIDLDSYRNIPAVGTSQVRVTGNIAPSSTTTNINAVTVFDASGASRVLSVKFTNNTANTPGSFLVAVTDSSGKSVGSGEVRFRTDGTPLTGYAGMDVVLQGPGGAQAIRLDFGTPGTLTGMTSLSGTTSSLSAKVTDGHGILAVNGITFDDKGVMQLTYSETEKRSGPQVALALFPNESALHLEGGRLIAGASVQERDIGRPGDTGFGRIRGFSLEMSNVDLTREFADMIVIQRGYQASSRVMTVSNEMIEQLYNSTRGG